MTMPTKPRIEPTDRSILRVTMTSTMPVAMTATDAVCTDRFHRLRGVRNSPPEKMLKADPDDGQRADHAEQARIELGGDQEALQRILRELAWMDVGRNGVLVCQV